MTRLDEAMATRFATLTLSHIGQEYPHKLDHVLSDDGDVLPPRVLHPIFHGSRAWCWRGIAAALGTDHPATPIAEVAAERHIAASLPHIADDYMGTHWLASFALLALATS